MREPPMLRSCSAYRRSFEVKVNISVYLLPEGCERLAKHGLDGFWHWHLAVRVTEVEQNGEMVQHALSSAAPPDNAILIAAATGLLPPDPVAAQAAVKGLESLRAVHRANAAAEDTKLTARINDILSLSYSESSK